MTIKITIEHCDADSDRPIEVLCRELDRSRGTWSEEVVRTLAPGASACFYVHLLREYLVREEEPEEKPARDAAPVRQRKAEAT